MIDWNTYIHFLLLNEIKRLKDKYFHLKNMGNTEHKEYKLYESMKRCMLEIAKDPTSDMYLLGNTMGKDHRDWRRSKQFLPDRYRLFFKYFSKELEIYYAWINNENFLRKEGSKTDCYNIFQKYLDKDIIPSEREILQQNSTKTNINKL